jgi:type IV secretion system protein VirD4
MFVFDDLIVFTELTGGAMVAGEAISLYIKHRRNKKESLATSKIGTTKDLNGLTGRDGLKISKVIQLSKSKTYEGVLCVGATGEHKTTSLFYPNLLSNDIKGSIVVTDPKAELYRDTAEYQRSIGRTPILFSPLNHSSYVKYNLLEQCKDTTEVLELAQCILLNGAKSLELQTGIKAGGIEWINLSLPLFAAALLYCKSKGKPINTISNALKLITRYSSEELDLLLSNAGEEVKEQYSLFKTCLDSPKTASSIKITLASNLQLFLDGNIERITSNTDFTAEELRKRPICLYISYPEHTSNYLSPFIATFFTQIIKHLLSKNGLPVIFMADEMANIGMINNFSSIVSTCRSREIAWLCCLQSISQLVQVYGRDNAKSILNNLKTKAILPSISDTETLAYVSDLTGDTEIQLKSTSQSGDKTTTSYNTSKKKLFNSDEIRRLKSDEILIIAHNRQPIIDKQNIYYVNPEYTNKIKICNFQ